MKKLITLILLNLLLCILANAQRLPEFDKAREIKLLEMNRDDVRKMFEKYSLDFSDDTFRRDSFSTKTANITVSYSDGDCSSDFVDWKSPEWKAEDIEITLETPIKVKKSEIDFSNYRKERKYINFTDAYVYHNKNLGIAYEINKGKIWRINLIPSVQKSSLLCDNPESKDYYSKKSWFDDELKDRIHIQEYANLPADVVNLILSFPEITATCDSSNMKCSDGIKTIAVFAVYKDPDNDVVTHSYTVSGGEIIGYGEKVVWDLSDVKPGTYTITAAVDDGCGFCGKSMTKTVVVKACPDCSNK